MSIRYRRKKRLQILSLLLSLIVGACLIQYFSKPMSLYTQTQPLQVYSPDWGVVTTMFGLGYPPYAINEPDSYQVWVKNPPLPKTAYDIGMRGQPNVELLAQLHPDLVIDTPPYTDNRSVYPNSIPTVSVDFFAPTSTDWESPPTWAKYADIVYTIANVINKPEMAPPYLAHSKQRIIEAGENIRAKLGDNRSILVSNFWDMRQLSVFNDNSTIKLAADMMGLDLLSIGKPTQWGSSYVYPSVLYNLPEDTCLIVIGPIPEMTKVDSVNSPIWQQSPFFAPDACVYSIAPVWTRAGIESMVSFANNLEAAVLKADQLNNAATSYNTNASIIDNNTVMNDISYAYMQSLQNNQIVQQLKDSP